MRGMTDETDAIAAAAAAGRRSETNVGLTSAKDGTEEAAEAEEVDNKKRVRGFRENICVCACLRTCVCCAHVHERENTHRLEHLTQYDPNLSLFSPPRLECIYPSLLPRSTRAEWVAAPFQATRPKDRST